jgi:hypothetical protein
MHSRGSSNQHLLIAQFFDELTRLGWDTFNNNGVMSSFDFPDGVVVGFGDKLLTSLRWLPEENVLVFEADVREVLIKKEQEAYVKRLLTTLTVATPFKLDYIRKGGILECSYYWFVPSHVPYHDFYEQAHTIHYYVQYEVIRAQLNVFLYTEKGAASLALEDLFTPDCKYMH